MNREVVPFFVSRLIGGRPVRWVPEERSVGDYEGRGRTLEIFNADAKEQRRLLGEIDKHKSEIETASGGPLVVIFHSVRQSEERHAAFLNAFPRPVPSARIPGDAVPPPEKCVDEASENGPHRKLAAAA